MTQPRFSLGNFLFGLLVGTTIAGYWHPMKPACAADLIIQTSNEPPDATWCPYLAYNQPSDSFKCANERGEIVQTQRGDLSFCPYMVNDHSMDGFRCAEFDVSGSLVKRVWLPGP